jgi:hypothetical protein
MTRLLFALLAASALLALPLAAAQDAPAQEQYVDCGVITEDGLIPVTLCLVRYAGALGEAAACIAWRLLWGQSAPCPLPIPL